MSQSYLSGKHEEEIGKLNATHQVKEVKTLTQTLILTLTLTPTPTLTQTQIQTLQADLMGKHEEEIRKLNAKHKEEIGKLNATHKEKEVLPLTLTVTLVLTLSLSLNLSLTLTLTLTRTLTRTRTLYTLLLCGFASFYCTFLFNKTFFFPVPNDGLTSLGTDKKKCVIK
jgi:hypothetical protein